MDLLQSYRTGQVSQYPKQRMSWKQGDVESSGTWEVRARSWPSLEETSQVGLKDKGSPDQQGTLLRKQEELQVDFHLWLPALPFLWTVYLSSLTPAKDSTCPVAIALCGGCLRAQSHAGVEHSHQGDKTTSSALAFPACFTSCVGGLPRCPDWLETCFLRQIGAPVPSFPVRHSLWAGHRFLY